MNDSDLYPNSTFTDICLIPMFGTECMTVCVCIYVQMTDARLWRAATVTTTWRSLTREFSFFPIGLACILTILCISRLEPRVGTDYDNTEFPNIKFPVCLKPACR